MIEPGRFLPLLLSAVAIILLNQAADLALLLPGTDFATPTGRVRQLLALEAKSPAIVTADLLLLWALLAGKWRRALRLTRAVHYLVGALLLALVPWFLSDAGRVAGNFGGIESLAFRIVVGRTLLMLLLLGIAALLVGKALQLALKEPQTAQSGFGLSTVANEGLGAGSAAKR
jgi:putative effector of murein hydrolase LrgA (UPF0299 family)